MIITLKSDAQEHEVEMLKKILSERGYSASLVRTQTTKVIVAIGKSEIDIRQIGELAGVSDVHRVSDAYKLVSRRWKATHTEIQIGSDFKIREGEFCIMAGPCSIESEAQVKTILSQPAEDGVKIMRGGVFKPRTSPYSFRGMGLEGLKMFSSLAHEVGIKIISEVLEPSQIKEMYEFVDVYQVGARNSQNFSLLHALGEVDKPVMLKRGISGTLEELLQSAEYIFANGNEQILLCERGIRSFEKSYRNTLDLNAIPWLKEKTHLPVIVDPSHGIGIRRFVEPMALAAIMAGADGIIVEIHEKPEKALSDGDQSLNLPEAHRLFEKAKNLAEFRD